MTHHHTRAGLGLVRKASKEAETNSDAVGVLAGAAAGGTAAWLGITAGVGLLTAVCPPAGLAVAAHLALPAFGAAVGGGALAGVKGAKAIRKSRT
ncbi:hypothetical protein BJ973_001376 [Actinoplanes tereljensis]|uniref:Uncharacterized protein n=1 Tax=Paractinoplanes tereljensis TaxID=571912 RepID=A0A919TSY9_9ACTN|nr:hypothetical protein [Actinoplanes tereljensis]GIF20719.1 hypothetical protein Ate02nite_34490 [Actinoplanes tereljensis]